MKKSKIIATLAGALCSFGTVANGSAPILQVPQEIVLKYEGGEVLKIRREKLGSLIDLSLKINNKIANVPPQELRDIQHTQLGNVKFSMTEDDDGNRWAVVTVEFESRTYPWGWDSKIVKFKFKNEKYETREVSLPSGKDTREIIR